jgi:hypothetical protein
MPVVNVSRRTQKQEERRAKPPRRGFASYSPRPPLLGSFTKESRGSKSKALCWRLHRPSRGPNRRCFLRSQPRRRLGLGRPLGRDPSRAISSYHGPSGASLKTGHFYFAGNRTFLLCLDRGVCIFWLTARILPSRVSGWSRNPRPRTESRYRRHRCCLSLVCAGLKAQPRDW